MSRTFIEDFRTGETLKRCSRCEKYKKLGEYHRSRSENSYGVHSRCIECRSIAKYHKSDDRFWAFYHSHTVRVGECLEWTGSYTSDGYPQYQRKENGKRKQWRVGRLVYKLAIGPVSDDMSVLLSCNNKRCVRQRHLILASALEKEVKFRNNAPHGDSVWQRTCPEKVSRGEHRYNSKLTEHMVREIRKRVEITGNQLQVARDMGLTRSLVRSALRQWKHVQ